MKRTYAFDFDLLETSHLEAALSQAHRFHLQDQRNFKALLVHAIGAVHCVAKKLHDEKYRNELCIYYGRSSADSNSIKGRWKSRTHRYGLILGIVPTKEVADAESDAINLFSLLQQNGTLCVKELENLKCGGNGPLPANKESVLYLTWAFSRYAREIIKPTPTEIHDLSEKAYDELIWNFSERSIRDIFDLTRQYSNVIPVRWFAGHPE